MYYEIHVDVMGRPSYTHDTTTILTDVCHLLLQLALNEVTPMQHTPPDLFEHLPVLIYLIRPFYFLLRPQLLTRI